MPRKKQKPYTPSEVPKGSVQWQWYTDIFWWFSLNYPAAADPYLLPLRAYVTKVDRNIRKLRRLKERALRREDQERQQERQNGLRDEHRGEGGEAAERGDREPAEEGQAVSTK